MEQLTSYPQIIQAILKPYADITYADTNVRPITSKFRKSYV